MKARIKKIYPEVDGLLSQMRTAVRDRRWDAALVAHEKLVLHFKNGGEMEPRHFDEMRTLYGMAMSMKVEETPELQALIV